MPELPMPHRRLMGMSNVVLFEPYRLRRRREKVAAACREAVARTGILVIQDASGHILTLTGQFHFFEDGLENWHDGCAARMPYDAIKRVKVPSREQFNGCPNSGP
jgi:hypothetical protein